MGWTQEHSVHCHACGKGIIQNSSPAVQSTQVHSEISPIHINSRIWSIPETALTTNSFMRPLPQRFNSFRLKHKQAEGFRSPCRSWGLLKVEGAWQILLSISIPISNCAPARAHYLSPLPGAHTTSPAPRNNGAGMESRAPSLLQGIRQVYTKTTEISVHIFKLFFFLFLLTVTCSMCSQVIHPFL